MTKLPEPTWGSGPVRPDEVPIFTITDVGEDKAPTVEIEVSEEVTATEPVVPMTAIPELVILEDQHGRHQSTLRSIELAYHRLMEESGAVDRATYTDGGGELMPEDEKIVHHALAVLPHIGPVATATYLASAVPA